MRQKDLTYRCQEPCSSATFPGLFNEENQGSNPPSPLVVIIKLPTTKKIVSYK